MSEQSQPGSEARAQVEATASDVRAQIADLRRKVEGLLAERTDSLNRGVDRVEAYAGDVAESVQYRYDYFQERVRERPVTSLLIAAAIGYAVARLTGR